MRSVAALLIAMLVPAGSAIAAAPPPPILTPPAPGSGDTAVPLMPIDIRMGVDVTINGAGPFHFIVDSGANRTVISRQLAHLLGLPSAGQVTLHSVGGVGEVEAARIDALKLGDVVVKPIVAPMLEQRDIGGAGILGIDVLAGRRVVIDLATDRMTIGPVGHAAAPARADGEIVVTARSRFGQLVLADADIAGRPIYAIIDSGTDTTIGNPALRARLARRQPGLGVMPTTLTDVAGRSVPIAFAMLDNVRIGSLLVDHVPVAFADAHAFHQFGLVDAPAMLVGMDVLRGFGRVSIDFARREVRFLPREQPGIAIHIDG